MIDQTEVVALQEQIAAHRSTLNIYLEQFAIHSQAYAPPHIIHGIRAARSEIQQKKIYLRSMGVNIDDQQNDFEEIVDTKGVQANDEYRSQVKLYRDICSALQSLSFAGDNLWASVTIENLLKFRKTIRRIKHVIEENAIYFETSDLIELRVVMSEFVMFSSGKSRLLYILEYGINSPDHDFSSEIRDQISLNEEYKREYDKLVEKIRVSFKARIR